MAVGGGGAAEGAAAGAAVLSAAATEDANGRWLPQLTIRSEAEQLAADAAVGSYAADVGPYAAAG